MIKRGIKVVSLQKNTIIRHSNSLSDSNNNNKKDSYESSIVVLNDVYAINGKCFFRKRGTAVPSFRLLHRSAKQVYPKQRSETAKTQQATIHNFRQAKPD